MSLVLGRILASLFFALPKVANDELKPLHWGFFLAQKNRIKRLCLLIIKSNLYEIEFKAAEMI